MIKTIKNVYLYFIKIWNTLKWTFFLFLNKRKIAAKQLIISEAYTKNKGYGIRHNNWGDDLNKYLFEFITGKEMCFVQFRNSFLKSVEHYILIGSILNNYNLDNTIVYGSGIMNPTAEVHGKPKMISSVRGPLTRKILIEKGMDCPQKYGDPALLLPLFYRPNVLDSKKISVIPHKGTSNEQVIASCGFLKSEHSICRMDHYLKWTDVIDEICSSSYVISESLHGLIIAEAYGIPGVWVEFKEHPDYWNFKFLDFYESIGKKDQRIIKLPVESDKVAEKIATWENGKIDFLNILECCPFLVKNELVIQSDLL